jgi:hypothetical protein
MSTTPPTADDTLMELVRGADPLAADTETVDAQAVESLLRHILDAPREERRPRTRPQGTALRVAAVGAVAVAAVGSVAVLTGDRDGAAPASAAVIRDAIAALSQPPGTILHVDLRGSQWNGDGTTIAWRDVTWQQNAAPHDGRQVETASDGTTVESADAGRTQEVYDPATNTIYASTPTAAHRRYWLFPGPTAGTFLLRAPVFKITPGHGYKVVPGGRRESVVITARQARALRDGTDVLTWRRRHPHGAFGVAVVPASAVRTTPSSADPSSEGFRDEILAMLRSGGAHVVGPATVAGRDTLEIRSRDGHTTYYVEPGTYAPVEIDTRGTGGGTRLRIDTYEVLPGNAANAALVSLPAQHPSATVDHSPADYAAAQERLYPNG